MENKYEQADAAAGRLIARITNGLSHDYLEEFPGCDALGLNPDDPDDKLTVHAFGDIFNAVRHWEGRGTNSAPYGHLVALLEYGLTSEEKIKQALNFYCINTRETSRKSGGK